MSRKSAAEWSALVREFEKSGLEQVAFCAPRGINVWTFRNHLYDSRDSSKSDGVARSESASKPRLVRVEMKARHDSPGFPGQAVDLAFAGVTMRVAVGTDTSYVAALISALRASSC